jgi:hypothetical protein
MPARSLARKPLPKPNPESDPRFRKVMEQLKSGAAKTTAHPPTAKKGAAAAAAAKGPPNERLAAGKAKQVDKIREAPSKKPEPASFLALLRAEIAKAMPKTLGETEKFMQGGSSEQLKGSLKGNVSQQKQEATGDTARASKAAPAPAGEAKVGGAVPGEPAPGAPPINAPEGMPAPKSDADVSLQDSKQDADAQMKEAEVTPQQLQKANDPRFSAVLEAKTQVARQADAAPVQFRASEQATLNKAAAGAQSDTRRGAAAMIGVRSGSNVRVLTRQQQQKAADEAARAKVVADIEQIYNDTKAKVEQKLASLDTEVGAMFDQGTEAALTAMTSFVNARLRDYKIDRYLSIPFVGAVRWIRDQFLGLPDEVNAFYEQGRQVFQQRMDALVVRVAALVERRLKEAKDEVAKGQAAIKDYVAKQPKSLQDVAQRAQKDVSSRFEELERGIEDKKNQLAQALAAKYKEAFDKANEALKKIQEENQGLVAAFVGKLLEVIKALLEFKDKLMSILRKGMEAIKLIIADPIGFLSNLISAVAGGIRRFVANIEKHMIEGFKQWLFGSLSGLGIEVPRDLSLPSILKLVLGVLGITFDRMREKAVRLLGDRNMRLITKLVEYIRVLISGGPAALWEKVKDDLANLKEMVIDAIKNYVIETAAKQGMARIVALFNPVGAIIAAIMAIYNVIMFVVEKASQLAAFVQSVVNSVYDIATGNISGAISKIEDSLARAIPLLIGFLARFAGLGNITKKIQEFITKVQAKVDAAIDKAIAKIVEVIKKLFGRGGGDRANGGALTPDERARLDGAVAKCERLLSDPHVDADSVQGHLPAIQQEFRLTSLTLAAVGDGAFQIIAKINPEEKSEAHKLLTANQKRALVSLGQQWAAKIKKDVSQADYRADRMGFLSGKKAKVKSGDAVELAGLGIVEAYAQDLKVLTNAHLQLLDNRGEPIGGAQAELDFLLVSGSSIVEIVSAKMQKKSVSVGTDRGHLQHFQSMPLGAQEILKYAMQNFGHAGVYRDVVSVKAVFSDGGSQRMMGLPQFRATYLQKVVVNTLKVTALTPAEPGLNPDDLRLPLTKEQLFRFIIEVIDPLI